METPIALQDLAFTSDFEDKQQLAALYRAAELSRRTPVEQTDGLD